MSEEENILEEKSEDRNWKSEGVKTTSQDETIQPPTPNDQPTTIMEVHKHPHHVTHKKKWTEYLLEFFMLFLAVFLALFLAIT